MLSRFLNKINFFNCWSQATFTVATVTGVSPDKKKTYLRLHNDLQLEIMSKSKSLW